MATLALYEANEWFDSIDDVKDVEILTFWFLLLLRSRWKVYHNLKIQLLTVIYKGNVAQAWESHLFCGWKDFHTTKFGTH